MWPNLILLCFLSYKATQMQLFFCTDRVLSAYKCSFWVSSLFTGRTDLRSLWTIIAHWSDLAQKDKNKMAAWYHGERAMWGGDRSLRGLLVSELRPGQPWRQVQVPRCVLPTSHPPTGQAQQQWGRLHPDTGQICPCHIHSPSNSSRVFLSNSIIVYLLHL